MIEAPPTGIEVNFEYFFLAYMYGICNVGLAINGVPYHAIWGAQFYPLPPGRYNVSCHVNYLFECGKNSIDVDLAYGQVVRVTWKAPHIIFFKGSIRSQLIASAPPSPMAGMPNGPVMPGPVICPRCGGPDNGNGACARCGHQLRF